METIKVQINFTLPTPFGDFTDAIYLTLEEYATITPEQLAQMEQDRVNNYIATVNSANDGVEEAVVTEAPVEEVKQAMEDDNVTVTPDSVPDNSINV